MSLTRSKISQAIPGFLEYMKIERRFRPKTIQNYSQYMSAICRYLGDMNIQRIQLSHVIGIKSRLIERGAQESHVANTINVLKSFLRYAQEILDVDVLDVGRVKAPRVPKREVTYLTPEELSQFLAAIPLRTWAGVPLLSGYCLRALVETLAATGMRISEALSLNRDSVDFTKMEASVIGKGNRQRMVFFTKGALDWIARYSELRKDSEPALFVSSRKIRVTVNNVHALFRRVRKRAGIRKHVTPHIIRHTTATSLLRAGCPIGFIKEILGHADLQTTCRYYLGFMSQAETKRAHERFSALTLPDSED